MARSVPYFGIKRPTSRRSDQPGDQGSIFLCFKKQKFPCSQGTGYVEKKRLHGTFTLDLQVQYKKITNTLYLRVDGSTRCKGHPFILIRPFPRLQKATAVAVFYRNNCPRIIHTTQKVSFWQRFLRYSNTQWQRLQSCNCYYHFVLRTVVHLWSCSVL